ncbi:hypothetical protein RB2654_13910 [Rhodobacterales bacterium HTCC2654]|uniref:Uncharacterized protein n=1 Tax=Maritimibacter alkaliphilus HTCC2654 TaxID=314271 RepID=A3VGI1_9RHOB|nr:hypothetical protein RB2654_13910 [Rhodobacterales bacterium HTCC2654] [Maritimibacter alkaliphilus HTCC2654]
MSSVMVVAWRWMSGTFTTTSTVFSAEGA